MTELHFSPLSKESTKKAKTALDLEKKKRRRFLLGKFAFDIEGLARTGSDNGRVLFIVENET